MVRSGGRAFLEEGIARIETPKRDKCVYSKYGKTARVAHEWWQKERCSKRLGTGVTGVQGLAAPATGMDLSQDG